MELNGLNAVICLMYSLGIMESSDHVKRGRKASHLHFVPLWRKWNMMNPFHLQHESRLEAYWLVCLVCFIFFSGTVAWVFFLCLADACHRQAIPPKIMLSLALNVKQGSCKSSLWLCTATNEMLSELISVPFTASLTKCGKSYIWADPWLLYPSITPGAGMGFALLVLAGNNGHVMGWRWTYSFIWYFSTASFRIWNCKSLSFYSQKGFKFELIFASYLWVFGITDPKNTLFHEI